MKFRAPANIQLRRAQLILLLAAVIPTGLMSAIGVLLLALGGGSRAVSIVAGVLVVAFCTSALTGYILGTIFLSRGASLARIQNDFLSSVSHELRTPLTSMRMFVETLAENRVTDSNERQRCLDLLQREMRRLEALVARLIDLSKFESGRHLFEHEPFPARAVVDDALSALHVIAMPDDPQVTVSVEDGLEIVGDREALAQALSNLLVNAYKYGGDDPRIALLVASREKEIEIKVSDRGPGIPRGEQRNIFEKFERGSAAIESGKAGTGLGLSIVKAIVDAHRGKLNLKSDSRSGTTFSILLPRTA